MRRRRVERPCPSLSQAVDLAIDHANSLGSRGARQSRHCADVAHQHNDKARARAEANVADPWDVPAWRAEKGRIVRERILCLGDAYRQPTPARGLKLAKLRPHRRLGRYVGRAINLSRDGQRLVPQTHLVAVQRLELRLARICKPRYHQRETFRACAAALPVIADDDFDPELASDRLFDERKFGRGVAIKSVYGDSDRRPELSQVRDMPGKI